MAAQRTPVQSGRGTGRARSRQPVGAAAGAGGTTGSGDLGSHGAGDRDPDAPGSVFEVSSVTVLPAGSAPGDEPDSAEGTPSDWLPGIRDEHEDSGWQARRQDRPTWDVTVTPNIRRRQGTRPPRRRR
jgi:hypothetical protein